MRLDAELPVGKTLYVVDGYNVIAVMSPGSMSSRSISGEGESLETLRDRLVDKMSEIAVREDAEVKIVFDGRREITSPGIETPGVQVMFSEKPHGADQVIERLTRDVEIYERVYVVTADYLQQRMTFRGKVLRMPPREIIEAIERGDEDEDCQKATRSDEEKQKSYRLSESVDPDVARKLKKMTRPEA